MYVDFETFRLFGAAEMSAEEYGELAPMADLVIDHWTLDRVGKAVRNGEALPAEVVSLYCAIVSQLPAVIEQAKAASGGDKVQSFSNGVDSFTFDLSVNTLSRLRDSVGWMVALLPVEWSSGVVVFEGGNAYAG